MSPEDAFQKAPTVCTWCQMVRASLILVRPDGSNLSSLRLETDSGTCWCSPRRTSYRQPGTAIELHNSRAGFGHGRVSTFMTGHEGVEHHGGHTLMTGHGGPGISMVMAGHRGVDTSMTGHRGVDTSMTGHRGVDTSMTGHRGVDTSMTGHRGIDTSMTGHGGDDTSMDGHRGVDTSMTRSLAWYSRPACRAGTSTKPASRSACSPIQNPPNILLEGPGPLVWSGLTAHWPGKATSPAGRSTSSPSWYLYQPNEQVSLPAGLVRLPAPRAGKLARWAGT
ncbi:hypothetical protein PCANC_09326 [Puccinia coronata f. sp. avenae]|uniref:Uncharacterized protein n=1 Tax=Puccinia coronata f. sp. avenae TaxID=200324 RepID=A0A2N5T5K8_9BASI|nr:hypothetical protein PCANC_09326 [Puccinia coronata f. sp. avenae]